MRRSHDHKRTTRTTTRPLEGAARFLLVAATGLLIAATALGAIALVSTAHLTTTQLAPFFDEVRPNSAQLQTVETRVGAFEICYATLNSASTPSERCFSYGRESPVMAADGSDVAFYACACTLTRRAWRGESAALNPTLAHVLGTICSGEGAAVRGLAGVSLLAGFVACLAMLDALALTNPNVRLRLRVALSCTVVGASCALTAYLSWIMMIRPSRHVMRQGLSAHLTLASAGAFVSSAVAIYWSHRLTSRDPAQVAAEERSTAVIL